MGELRVCRRNECDSLVKGMLGFVLLKLSSLHNGYSGVASKEAIKQRGCLPYRISDITYPML